MHSLINRLRSQSARKTWATQTLLMLPILLPLCPLAHAQSADFKPILPDNLLWFSPPNNASLKVAWVLGADQKPGVYLLRVKLAAGGKIPPHTQEAGTGPTATVPVPR